MFQSIISLSSYMRIMFSKEVKIDKADINLSQTFETFLEKSLINYSDFRVCSSVKVKDKSTNKNFIIKNGKITFKTNGNSFGFYIKKTEELKLIFKKGIINNSNYDDDYVDRIFDKPTDYIHMYICCSQIIYTINDGLLYVQFKEISDIDKIAYLDYPEDILLNIEETVSLLQTTPVFIENPDLVLESNYSEEQEYNDCCRLYKSITNCVFTC